MRSVIRQAKTIDQAIDEALLILGLAREDVEVEVLEEPQSGLFGIFGSKDAVVRVTAKDEDIVSEIIKEAFDKDQEEGKSFEEGEDPAPISKAELSEKVKEEEPGQVLDRQVKEGHTEAIQKDQTLQPKDQNLDEFGLEEGLQLEEAGPKDQGMEPSEPSNQVIDPGMEDDGRLVSQVLLEKILKGMDIEGQVEARLEGRNIHMEITGTSQRDTRIIIGRRGDTLDAIEHILTLAQNKKSDRYMRIYLDISSYRDRRKESLIRLAERTASKVRDKGSKISLDPMNAYERKIIHTALQDQEDLVTYSQGKDPRRRVVVDLAPDLDQDFLED